MTEEKKKHPGGRPSTYTEEKACEILRRLTIGESLRSICRDENMPAIETVYYWMMKRPEFSTQYARAREEQAETYADEIVALIDEEPRQVVDDKGIARVDNGWVSWQRNRIDARKWIASKLKPKRYGDRVAVTGAEDGAPIKVEAELEATKLLEALLTNAELKKKADE